MSGLDILVADDHELVREGIRAVLERQPGWRLCAEATNGREAVELATRHRPDLVIIDVGMPELNGLEAARMIRRELPGTEVLILTMHESEQLVHDIIAADARGYLLKSDAARLLVSAVEALAQHRPFFTGKVCEMVLRGQAAAAAGEVRPQASQLTPREREIVQALAEGKSNKSIAHRLGLSAKTVDTHRTNVMRKLGLHSISELVRYAVRNKIVDP